MKGLTAALIILSACVALRAEGPTKLLRCDFSKNIEASPWLQVVGDAAVEGGVLRSASMNNWKRSGLLVGPVPVGVTIEYTVRPLVFGRQGQEFASETPSAHHYMIFVAGDGGIRLYTRLNGEWKPRATSKAKCKIGAWYRVTVFLRQTQITCTIAERDSGAEIWNSGPIEMDDIGTETVFGLIDESAQAGEARTVWDDLVITTDDNRTARLWAETEKQLQLERAEKARREKQIAALRSAGIALIPMPQEILLRKGEFPFCETTALSAGDPQAEKALLIVRDVLEERIALKPPLGEGGITLRSAADPNVALWRKKQSYALAIQPDGIHIEAASPAGFFYAAQTLSQIARDRKSLPYLEIRDWPAIENRLVMVAVSQGAFQVIDLDYWKRMIRELAAVKINAIMPYFEGGTFYYEKYPFLGRKGRDGFTIEKGKILSEYAREHFIEMIPQQESLGHSGTTLGHKETKHLREAGGTFCSSKPEVFAFLGDLFDELVQAFPYARYIHVGGDEFHHGFAKCPQCKARAEEIGLDGLYAEHMMKLHKLLADRNRGMMIWWHEKGFTESAHDKLAKDIVVFDWHYGNQRDYPSLDKLIKLGFSQTWATPAITRYYRKHADDWYDTFGNIQGFMKAGLKRNVPGECTCTWVHGIWGGRNLFELNYYGLLFSGECAWNPLASSEEDFQRKFAVHWFGLSGKELEQEVHEAIHAPYGEKKEQKFWRDCRALEPILGEPPKSTVKMIEDKPELVAEARELLVFCDRADAILNRWTTAAKRNKRTIDFLKHDVHMHRAAANRILCIAKVLEWHRRAKGTPPDDVIKPLQNLLKEYDQIGKMFKRSIKEAGGGECEKSTAEGGIRFRLYKGRKGIEKLINHLKKGAYDEDL
ncbi:MAG: family 20 glycosylhydrolase [Planctomycetes bacterium]|nr:family 20 glycosylhydrolase [Planctomycetota bacterium]